MRLFMQRAAHRQRSCVWPLAVAFGWRRTEHKPIARIQGEYLISVIDAEDMSLPAGTHVGSLRRTPTPGRYIASLLSNPSRIKSKKRNLVVTLRPEGSLSFEPYRSGKRISLWRWIPYLFRVTVVQEGHQPADIEGAVRPGTADLTRHRIL